MATKKRNRLSPSATGGSAYRRAAGLARVEILLPPETKADLDQAAKIEQAATGGRASTAGWLLALGISRARTILENSEK